MCVFLLKEIISLNKSTSCFYMLLRHVTETINMAEFELSVGAQNP